MRSGSSSPAAKWIGEDIVALIGEIPDDEPGIAHMVPYFSTRWFNEEVTFGGTNVGSGLGAVGNFFSMLAGNASFQGTRTRASNTSVVTVPTPEQVRGNFGDINIYDPANVVGGNRQQFTNNVIQLRR